MWACKGRLENAFSHLSLDSRHPNPQHSFLEPSPAVGLQWALGKPQVMRMGLHPQEALVRCLGHLALSLPPKPMTQCL